MRRCLGLQKVWEKHSGYAQLPHIFLFHSYLKHGISDFETRINNVKKILLVIIVLTTTY